MPNTYTTPPTSASGKNLYVNVAKPQDNLDLREFWRVITRWKKTILGALLGALLASLLLTLLSSPTYRATATLQVEREVARVMKDIQVVETGDIRDTRDFYQTQFELIKSSSLIERVVDQLKLQPDVVRTSLFKRALNALNLGTNKDKRAELVNDITDNLTIEPIMNSRLVKINFDGSSPEKAAEVANAIVDTFTKMNLERRFQISDKTQDFLRTQLESAKTKLQESEKTLNQYARENGIIMLDNKDTTSTSHAIVSLSEELVRAESEVVLIETDPKRKGELKQARERAEKLRDLISKEEEKALQLQDKSSTYNTLEREVATNQAIYQSLLQRIKEIDAVGGGETNNLIVIDRAKPPLQKYKPNLPTNLAFAGLFGLLLGVTLAFIKEFLDDSVRDVAKVEQHTQLPVLGLIPASQDSDARKLAQLTLNAPKSPIAEAFRSLRTTLRYRLKDENNSNIIFITSSRPNEGKTTTAMNLASTYANSGNRVLLIDADLRNPSLHQLMGVRPQRGLVSYLSAEHSLDGVIQASNVQNLDVILAGNPPQSPSELLGSPKMEALLQIAARNYNIVILDGPPVLGLADALILASLANMTILVVHAGQTRMVTVTHALKRLRESGATIAGVLLNQVKDTARLGYGEDYYHYPSRKNAA